MNPPPQPTQAPRQDDKLYQDKSSLIDQVDIVSKDITQISEESVKQMLELKSNLQKDKVETLRI
jgi:hypothetical protein